MNYKIDKRHLIDAYVNRIGKEFETREIEYSIESKHNQDVFIVFRDNILGSIGLKFNKDELEVFYIFTTKRSSCLSKSQKDLMDSIKNADVSTINDSKSKFFREKILIKKQMNQFKSDVIVDTYGEIENILKSNMG